MDCRPWGYMTEHVYTSVEGEGLAAKLVELKKKKKETTHIFNPAILLGIYFLNAKVPSTNLKKNIYIHSVLYIEN